MKTIFSFMFLAFISVVSAQAQTKNEAMDNFQSLLKCQAGFNIVAYYIDIYKELNTLLDKNDLSSSSDDITSKLVQDFLNLEDQTQKLKQEFDMPPADLIQMEMYMYNEYKNTMLEEGFSIGVANHLQQIMHFVNLCKSLLKDPQTNQ